MGSQAVSVDKIRPRQTHIRMEFDPNLLEVLDSLPEVAILSDPLGRVLHVNQEAFRLWGRSPSPVGQLLAEVIPAAAQRRAVEQIAVVLGGGQHARREWRVRSASGEPAILDVHASLLMVHEHVIIRFLASDVTRSRRAEESVAKLSERLLRLQDEERRRLARDLHDSTGQNLAALGMKLGQVERVAARLDGDSQSALRQAIELAAACSREIRTLSYLLHPPLLDELGLAAALKWFVEGFSARSNIRVALEFDAEIGRLPGEVEITIFRVVQEALTNVHRHSGSQKARIALRQVEGEIVLEVQDWGGGRRDVPDTEPRSPRLGVGVAGMRERVRQLGGELEVSITTAGASVLGRIPVGATERDDTDGV